MRLLRKASSIMLLLLTITSSPLNANEATNKVHELISKGEEYYHKEKWAESLAAFDQAEELLKISKSKMDSTDYSCSLQGLQVSRVSTDYVVAKIRQDTSDLTYNVFTSEWIDEADTLRYKNAERLLAEHPECEGTD